MLFPEVVVTTFAGTAKTLDRRPNLRHITSLSGLLHDFRSFDKLYHRCIELSTILPDSW